MFLRVLGSPMVTQPHVPTTGGKSKGQCWGQVVSAIIDDLLSFNGLCVDAIIV